MEQSVCLNGNGYVYRWPFTCSNWPHSEKFLHFYLGWYLSFRTVSCRTHIGGIRRRKLYNIHTWSRQAYELQWFHATFTTNRFFGAHYFMEFEKVERCYGLQRASGVINDSNVLLNLNIENKMRFWTVYSK